VRAAMTQCKGKHIFRRKKRRFHYQFL